MSKILFTHSYFYRFDPKMWKDQRPYPPYGTIYAAALMREQGHEVALFDTALEENPHKLPAILDDFHADYLVIYDDGFNYLTKMCLTNMREAAHEMSKVGQERGCKVIVCSSDSTDHYDKYLDNGADFVILGEGEIGLNELIDYLNDKGEDFEQIMGIAFRRDGKTIKTLKRPVLRDLDQLPDPAWDLIDVESYQRIWEGSQGFRSLNIATTRGCPYKCNWCAKPIYGNRYNNRSPQRVINEIEMHIKQHKVNYFWMCDDIFGLKPGWVQEFRDLAKAKNLQFKYKIQSRVDLLLKEDTIDALADSGLHEVWVGAESGSQKILDAMDKGTQLKQIYEATRLLKKKGVRVCFFLQFGYLGETREDIDKTIQMLLDLMPDDIGISVSYPLPGTKFYDKVEAQMKDKQNWEDSDDLAMMFEGTYGSAYYKRLHRYVHKLYRRKQGFENLKLAIQAPTKVDKRKLRSVLANAYYVPGAFVDAYRLKRLEVEKQ